jgi:hypothetical protein
MSLWLMTGCAVLSGFLFSLLGVTYRLGANRRIPAPLILTLASTVGFVWFGLVAGSGFAQVPWWFFPVGIGTGLMQYLLVHLHRIALRLGPLSPLWCAVMLSFVPVILYFWLVFDEPLSIWSLGAMAAALAAVVAAAASGHAPAAGESAAGVWRRRILYGLVLVAVLLVNSQASVANKTLSHKIPDFASLFPVYLSLLYLGLAAPGWIEIAVRRPPALRARALLPLAALATLGTMGGMFCQNLVIAAPAALVFTVICSSSILSSALLSVLVCGERRTRAWYLTLLFALAAILCSQGGALLALFSAA